MGKFDAAFHGAAITTFDCRRTEVGTFVRLHLIMDLNPDFAARRHWGGIYDAEGEITEGWESIELTEELTLEKFSLSPVGMEANAIDLPASLANAFEVSRRKVKGKDEYEYKLRFTVKTRSKTASATLETYWNLVGEAPADLVITYDDEPGPKPKPKEKPAANLFNCELCAAGVERDPSGQFHLKGKRKYPCEGATDAGAVN